MIQQILSTTWKDLKILFKDPGGMATLFLMPMMFIIIMSTALKGMFETGDGAQPRYIPVVNQDHGHLAAEAVDQLASIEGIEVETVWNGEEMTRQQAEALVSAGERAVAVVFPADFTEQIEARIDDPEAQATVELITDPAVSIQFIAPIQGMVFGVAERVAETELAEMSIAVGLDEIFAQLPPGAQPPAGALELEMTGSSVVGMAQVAPPDMGIEVFPDTYQQNVPGYTVFGVFFIVAVIASSVLREKHDGTFRRLLVAPLPKPALLAGKLLPYYLVNLLQVAIMFAVAHLMFGMELTQPLALAVLSLALSAAATSLGVLVATFGKTETQVEGMTSLLTLTMSALGGCLVPTMIMPEFLQTLSRFTPHGWAMQGFQDVLVRGYGLSQIGPEIGALFGFAAVFFLVGVVRFRFD